MGSKCINLARTSAASLALAVSAGLAADPPTKSTVSVHELGKSVTLVGVLGKPLAQMMSVRGSWAYPNYTAKDNSLRFTVTHVDGRQLSEPVVFYAAQVEAVNGNREPVRPRDGAVWTLRAYEWGEYLRKPNEYWNEFAGGVAAGEPAWQASPFVSRLQGVLQAK